MEKLLKKFLDNILIILLFLLGIIVFYADKILELDFGVNNKILFITFLALIWYAEETRKTKNELTSQTQIQQKPILVLYVRKDKDGKLKNYRIIDNQEYVFRVRNVGMGAAANLKVEIDNSKYYITDYQQNFLAPHPQGDEQSLKITGIQKIEDLNGVVLTIKCQDYSERWTSKKYPYQFKYKIQDIISERVELII